MGKVLVDGIEVEVSNATRLNGIQAARMAGIDVPHYCWHAGLSVVASCRMCLVETGTRNAETGAITMLPKLAPACQTPATDGTVFVTNSEKVKQARAMVEEDLLIDHPIDCPICDKAGECYLQDYHFEHGQKERRADIHPFTSHRRDVGPTVTLFVDRCVMCSRCVRFCREVAGTNELMVVNRGAHEEIDVFPGYPLENKLAGNVVDLCPVGALGDKDFLYRQRVWFLKRHQGVCTGCSTGCSIFVEENQDRVWRLKPRENAAVNQFWMCDEGRYGYHHVHDPNRLVGAEIHRKDKTEQLEWSDALIELVKLLPESGRLAVAISPHLTVEEAYLLAKYARAVDPDAVLALGHVPVVGEDEVFKSGFTIRAEKCPNRRGVEEVLKHFAGEVQSWEQFVSRVASESFAAVWVTGGHSSAWVDESVAARFDSVPLLIAQDMFGSPLWDRAHVRLPGGAFAEREGSYVNFAGRLQRVGWAVRPPAGARVEGSVYWRLLEMGGLYSSRKVLDEVAATIPFFASAAGAVPETGIDLVNASVANAEPALSH